MEKRTRRALKDAPEPVRDDSEIKEKISEFYKHDQAQKNEKKKADELKSDIKEYFYEHDIESLDADGLEAKITVQDNSVFDSEKAINILKSAAEYELIPEDVLSSVVKTKEYIDEDALERFIYNKTIPADLVQSCIEQKAPIVKLTVKVKKKKGGNK